MFGRSTSCFVNSTGKSSQVRGGGRLGHWLPIDSTGDGWVRFCGFRRGVSDYPYTTMTWVETRGCLIWGSDSVAERDCGGHWLPIDGTGDGWVRFCERQKNVWWVGKVCICRRQESVWSLGSADYQGVNEESAWSRHFWNLRGGSMLG